MRAQLAGDPVRFLETATVSRGDRSLAGPQVWWFEPWGMHENLNRPHTKTENSHYTKTEISYNAITEKPYRLAAGRPLASDRATAEASPAVARGY